MTKVSFHEKPLMAILVRLGVAIATALMVTSVAQAQSAPTAIAPDGWPWSRQVGPTTFTVYQPQLDAWNGYDIAFQAAASAQETPYAAPVFGVVEVSAKAYTDKLARVVELKNLRVDHAKFPSAREETTQRYRDAFQAMIPPQQDRDRDAAPVESAEERVAVESTGRGRSSPIVIWE